MTPRLFWTLVLTGCLTFWALVIGGVTEAVAHGRAGVAVDCHTVEKRGGVVTTVHWSHAVGATKHINMTVRRTPFSGDRAVVRRAQRVGLPLVVSCRVVGGDVMLRSRGGVRIRVTQPPLPPPASVVSTPSPDVHDVVVPTPTNGAPQAVAVWTEPVVLYAPVSDDWQVDTAVSAWNVALPADRQVLRVSTPCDIDVACISVGTMAPNPNAWGLATQVFSNGRMESCAIGLGEDVPLSHRRYVTVHEIGHCLGLVHWSAPHTIMHPEVYNMALDGLPSSWDLEWLSSTYAR